MTIQYTAISARAQLAPWSEGGVDPVLRVWYMLGRPVMTSAQKRWSLIALLILTAGICLHTAVVKKPLNYSVVTKAAGNILGGHNPYAPQPGLDFFKYSPLAGLLTVPFSLLRDEVGLFLFIFFQYWLFFWGFQRWARSAGCPLDMRISYLLVAVFSVLFDTTVAIQNAQVNAGILGLMLLAAAQYAENKPVRSGLLLSLAANLKLFPFTLGLCLLMGFRKKYWAAFWGGLVLWFTLPAAAVGWSRNLEMLKQWVGLMSWDQTRSLDMLDLASFLELHLGWSSWWREPLALLVGVAIGLTTLYLFRGRQDSLLYRFLLPVNGLYILLFSYLSESPTSILAVAAIFLIGIEALEAESHRRIFWFVWAGSLALVPIFYSDLVPRAWNVWAQAWNLKTVGYVWTAAACLFLVIRHARRSAAALQEDPVPI